MKSGVPTKRSYDASGRQAAARVTHDAIVKAATECLHRVRPEALAYADVAERSGVALRTVYRHFPTPEDLLGAVLQRFLSEIGSTTNLEQLELPELADTLERLHARLSAEPNLYRLFFVLPARSGSGMAAMIQRVCSDALAHIPAEHHGSVCAAVELQCSPYAWEVFHSQWGIPPARTTRTLLVSVQLLLDGFVANPRALALASPLPPMFRAATTRTRK